MAADKSTPSVKINQAVGNTAFLHNNTAKDDVVAATVNGDGSVTIDARALLQNDPGSAAFVGLLHGTSLLSDVGGISFENGYHYADSTTLAGYQYDAATGIVTLSAADALAMGIFAGDGFDYVIRTASGTYGSAHVTLSHPNPSTPTSGGTGHWVELIQNGDFTQFDKSVSMWNGVDGSPEGGVGFWTQEVNSGQSSLQEWAVSINGGDQKIEIMTSGYLDQVSGQPVRGLFHEGNSVDTHATPGGVTLSQSVNGADTFALTPNDQLIYADLGAGTTIGQLKIALTVAAQDIAGFGHTSGDDVLSVYFGGVFIGGISMADFTDQDTNAITYNEFRLFEFDIAGNGFLIGANDLLVVDHSAQDAMTGIYADDVGGFSTAANGVNADGNIGFALNHVSVLEWLA
jgi:hypothetical protein